MNNDPLLQGINFNSLSNDPNSRMTELLRLLEELRNKLNQPPPLQPQPQQPRENLFEGIEREFEGLTDQQKEYIYNDSDFKKTEQALLMMIQNELISIALSRLNSNPKATETLRSHIDNIKLAKKQMSSEKEKELALFKEYTENHSDITFKEFLELKQN